MNIQLKVTDGANQNISLPERISAGAEKRIYPPAAQRPYGGGPADYQCGTGRSDSYL